MHLQATMQTILSLHKEANKGSLEFCDSSSENSKYCDHSSQWRLDWRKSILRQLNIFKIRDLNLLTYSCQDRDHSSPLT